MCQAISKTELQGLVDLLNHSAQQVTLTRSYGVSDAGMAAFNSTFETEVSYVVHVLAKVGVCIFLFSKVCVVDERTIFLSFSL